jgi:alpha/beta superfamily hydrolase
MCYERRVMARVDRLPPPPPVPVRSPPAAVAGETEERVEGLAGGPQLECRVHFPAAPVRAVVLCHPHPLYGGSMHSPVPLAIARQLAEQASQRVAWARFNYRGIGSSEGSFDQGRGEMDDTLAVLQRMRRGAPGLPITVCGHSFGSWVGLRAACQPGSGVDRALLVAPSSRMFAFGEDTLHFGGQTTIFLGTEDEFCDVAEGEALARRLGATMRVFEGFDHHFLKSRRALAEAAVPVIVPEA